MKNRFDTEEEKITWLQLTGRMSHRRAQERLRDVRSARRDHKLAGAILVGLLAILALVWLSSLLFASDERVSQDISTSALGGYTPSLPRPQQQQ